MEKLENLTVMGVELWRILLFVGILFVVILFGRLLRYILRKISRGEVIQANPVRVATVYALSRSITFVTFALGFYLGLPVFKSFESFHAVMVTCADILIVIAIGAVLFYLIEVPTVWFEGRLEKTQKDMNKMFLPVIRKTLRGVLIVLVLIQIFQILSDKPITSIIAGLGIGGLAVALAAQDTLRHFFGSVVLVGDKPFDIGDRIVIDGHDGPVESVDLRSTRIRTLEGHLVTIPNGELANKTIQNIGKRPHIRRLSNITITYDTPPDKVREAKRILEDILKDHEGLDPEFPPRVYFSEFNADSLNLMMIYWYTPPDYWQYMEFSDRVNQEILERFNKAGIEFAFPTQTVHLKGES